MTPRRYTDLAGAAVFLGMSEDSIRAKVKRREIPYHKVDRRLRFKFEDLDYWMDRHRVETDAS